MGSINLVNVNRHPLAIISVTILSVFSFELSLTGHVILKLFHQLYCFRSIIRWLAEMLSRSPYLPAAPQCTVVHMLTTHANSPKSLIGRVKENTEHHC